MNFILDFESRMMYIDIMPMEIKHTNERSVEFTHNNITDKVHPRIPALPVEALKI